MIINTNLIVTWILGFILGLFVGFVIYTLYCGRKYIKIMLEHDEGKDDDTKETKIENLKELLREIRYS